MLAVLLAASLTASAVPRAIASTPSCFGKPATLVGSGRIEGTGGNDVIVGSRGRDFIKGLAGDDVICGLAGRDFIVGGTGSDQISSGGGGDRVGGGGGDDAIYGDGGWDWLTGRAGDDLFDGGSGMDGASFWRSPGSVEVNLATSSATGEGNDSLADIERVSGSRFDDVLVGDDGPNRLGGNEGADVISGGGDNDTLTGWEGNDELFGSSGDDVMDGTMDADVLHGGAGDDSLSGGDGDDILDGGDGSDTGDYFWSFGNGVSVNLTTGVGTGDGLDVILAIENVRGTEWADELIGNDSPNFLDGDYGADRLSGLGGDDVLAAEACCRVDAFGLDGGAGNDWLDANGTGTLVGGPGDDKLTATAEGSMLDGGPGRDIASYVFVFESGLYAGVSSDIEANLATGIAQFRDCELPCDHDTLTAIEDLSSDWGDDLLVGDDLANTLTAGPGDDEIIGGNGDDVLDGGTDYFDGDSGDGGGGIDTCKDIEHASNCEALVGVGVALR